MPVHRLSTVRLCVCLSGSLHVCLCRCVPSKPAYPVSQTTSEQRQGAGDATIRKIQYRIMGLCSALLLLLLLLYFVCRYGGTKLHIAAALCRRLCGHSLLSISLSLLLLVLLLVCVFCLFSFFDLIENLENQVNSLGDSRQCICGWIV